MKYRLWKDKMHKCEEDRMIRAAPTVSLSTIQNITSSSITPFPHSVVHSTVSRYLSEVGLRSQWSLRRLTLTPQHRRNRLE
ncbi:hypothetical protein TNCV_902081 [Trichonephila clavipes]|nr:hypothetical protein TNCV_902081 [Trichonephila clavipes]